VQLKDILKEKRLQKFTKPVLFLHDNASAHRAHATRRNWPTWASNALSTHPILRIGPLRTTTCSLNWGEKKKTEGRHFSSSAVIAAWETWLDGQPSQFFFEWLAKDRTTG